MEPTTTASIVTGVVSGILTTVLLFLLSRLLENIVFPWYRSLVYRGVDISGHWSNEITFGNGVTQTAVAEIEQKAHFVHGTVAVTKTKDGQHYDTKSLRLSGQIKDRLLSCHIQPSSNSEIAAANLLLEVVGNGATMKGATAWYDSNAATIRCQDSLWQRVK